MVKNIFLYIFIYVLCIGCETPIICDDCYLDVSADLHMDENGYYHLQFLNGHVQTFSTLEVKTGITKYNQKVKWLSNKEILIAGYWTSLVNQSSYTDNDGKAYTVLGVWENFIGDTIKVYNKPTNLDSASVFSDPPINISDIKFFCPKL